MRLLLVLVLLLVLGPLPRARAEDDSLGEKVKKFFTSTPTPTPSHRRHKRSTKQSSPTPSPSPTTSPTESPKAKRKHKASPTPSPDEEETPKPKRKKASPTPSPGDEETPKPKRKKASPTPSPTPSASPTETPTPSPEESPTSSPERSAAPTASPKTTVATISPNEISGYEKYPDPVRKILEAALDLTTRNLAYTYGSADPANGGMDCSGFIYFVLQQNGIKDVPRDSAEQYVWVRKAGNFRAVLSHDLDSFELDELKPGDLLFWTGTYGIARDPPVTHTMIYLGRAKSSGKQIMVGATDGRTYDSKQRFGVSVFDFKTAKPIVASGSGRNPTFVGYGRIPGLTEKTP